MPAALQQRQRLVEDAALGQRERDQADSIDGLAFDVGAEPRSFSSMRS